MAADMEEYGPYNTGAGASVGEAQWGRILASFTSSGVSPQVLDQFRVSQRAAGANMSVDVAAGQVMLDGHQGRNTSVVNLAIAPNASGATRFDQVIAVSNRTIDKVQLDIRLGSGGGLGALVQNSDVWESHIATIAVPNAASSITNGAITNNPTWAVARQGAPSALAVTDYTIDQTIPTGVSTIFDLFQPFSDSGGFWSADHPSRLTVPYAGMWLCGAQLLIYEMGKYPGHANAANVAKGSRSISIVRDGGAVGIDSPQYWWWGATPTDSGGGPPYGGITPDARIVGCCGPSPLAGGEYIELSANQTSGGTMEINAGLLWITYLGVL